LGASELERAREEVIRKHAVYAAARTVRVMLVFDGQNDAGPPARIQSGKIRVIYSRPPENADALIKRLVQAEKQPRNTLVVTSDQPLARFVQSCGAQLLSSEQWRHKLEQGRDADLQEKHGGSNDLDLDEWLQLFGEN
nr:NYN domain-containing protein [bacterium]